MFDSKLIGGLTFVCAGSLSLPCVAQTQPERASTPAVAQPSAPPAPADSTAEDPARFSVGRLFAEMGAGIVLGSGSAYLIANSLCDGSVGGCLGGFLGGTASSIFVGSLGVWGTGQLMGGEGGYGATLVGELLPFAFTAPFAGSPVAFGMALALGPVTAAFAFEVNSSASVAAPPAAATRTNQQATITVRPVLAPLVSDNGRTRGGMVGAVGTF